MIMICHEGLFVAGEPWLPCHEGTREDFAAEDIICIAVGVIAGQLMNRSMQCPKSQCLPAATLCLYHGNVLTMRSQLTAAMQIATNKADES